MSFRSTSNPIFGRGKRALAAVASCLALLASPAVLAQLSVSGPITTDTRWTITNSPVRVTGNVLVEGGATLSIDPGVRVEFAADTSLVVRVGALYAVGTPSSRVVFTSTRVAAQAQPGDWKGVIFEPGTVAASSAIAHAVVEFGSGIDLRGASPTLRNLALRNNEGPAVSVDTASSPIGEAISAEGNGLNGILVASGVITGDVIWGLRGIPYVVASGTVEVGALGFGLVPERLRLVAGVRGSLELSLPNAAPAGGVAVTLSSSVPSAVRAPASVSVAEGATRAAIEIEALALGTSVITASRSGFEPARAEVEVLAAPALQLPASLTLNPGEARTLTLGLSERAPDTGLEIALSNSASAAMTAPTVVRVAPRARSAQFEVRGVAAGQARLAASTRGWASATSDVLVRGRSLILPAQISVRPSRSTDVTVSVSQPVDGQPLQVTLTTNQSGILGLPSTASIAVGQSSVVVQAQGQAEGTVWLTATAAGYESATAPAVVQTLALSWGVPKTWDHALRAEVAYTPQGFTNSARLLLNRAAPAGGVRVRLRAANTALVAWPLEEIVIPEGQTQAPSLVRFSGLAQGLTELIAESDDADEARHAVSVGAPLTLRVNFGRDANLGLGMAARPIVLLESEGRYVTLLEPVTVEFSSSDPQSVEVAASVAVDQIGSGRPGPLIRGRGVTATPVRIAGRLSQSTAQGSFGIAVSVPEIEFFGLENVRAVGSPRDNVQVVVRSSGRFDLPQWLAESIDAHISVIDAAPEGLISGIFPADTGGASIAMTTIAAGGIASPWVWVGQPTTAGTYRLRAIVPGIGAADSELQQVVTPALVFGRAEVAVGVGMRTAAGRIAVDRRVGTSSSPVSAPLTIQLEISDASRASIPAQVTIPAGRSRGDFQIEGLALTSGPVTIRASALGHESGTAMQLHVLAPSLRLDFLDAQRNVGDPRDLFEVRVVADHPSAVDGSTTVAARSVALSVVAPTPPDLIEGFFATPSAGAPITTVTIPAGSASVAAYVGGGQVAGTYRVRAESVGAASVESGEQRIVPSELVFNLEQVVVGQGMESTFHLYVERRRNGQLFNSPSATTVALANPRPDALSLPATVTIPAWVSRVQVPVRGLLAAAGVRVSARALNIGGSATTNISVAQPRLGIFGLDGTRTLTSGPDGFYVALQVGEGGWNGFQTAVRDFTVSANLINRSPENVVSGLFSDAGATSPASSVVIRAGQSSSSSLYVARPSAIGTYEVSVNAANTASTVSLTQSVTTAAIRFSSFYAPVGTGFQKSVNFQFVTGDGDTFYNTTPITMTLVCVDATVCSVDSSIVVPPSCGSECSGESIFVRGLRAGYSRLRASAPGFDSAEIDVYVRNPLAQFHYLPASIAPAAEAGSFYVSLCVPGDRAFGENVPCHEWQTQVVDYTIDLVSDVPGLVDVVTPSIPGKVVITAASGSDGWSEALRLRFPTPRVPISATISASGPGVLPSSQVVRVE